ncbi:MAG: hypothetical protein Q8N53_20325 [Longimicrobiales bacterium]|nr:hypothetical protein [Longimicrobiales bacterium]
MHLPPLLSGLLFLSAAFPGGPGNPAPVRWGAKGHEMAAWAAASALPEEMPGFFRQAAGHLAYLNPEPDRWRSRPLREMDQAWSYDHYIDLENVPPGALEAGDRWVYLKALYDAGLEKPERDGGFLPFHIVELYQRLVTEWRLWRTETEPDRRAWIEERIVNDAGILGHYVTDAANPHHTTIHFNGWAEGSPNPAGYTTGRDFHARFESDFVEAHVSREDVRSRVPREPRSVAGSARQEVMEHIVAANAQVEALYRLDKEIGFDPKGPLRAETRDFAAERLAAGADMLRVLWWSAWLESEGTP